ncbi:MAG: protein translocase subunit SecD [Oscillospiraceae bacterium]|nr:protein translocase subunit SecD [Oscillospiraceae bacterium]
MGKNIALFLGVLVIIALLITVAFTGVDLMIFEIPKVEEGIIPGLDLKGGSIITYEANADEVSTEEMNTASSMLRQRLTALGYTEANLYLSGTKRITIEIPNLSDPEEAVRQIGSTAQLEFRDYTGKVWLTGDAVESAKTGYRAVDQGAVSQHLVDLVFKPEFRDTWTEVTKFAAQQSDGNNYIAVYMDDKEVFAPSVGSQFASTGIEGEGCIVTFGSNAAQTAREFADFIMIGRLPFELRTEQLSSVGPTLGETALNTSLLAGGIGLGLVILFMIAYYRLPGLMAAISLLLYTALVAIALSVMRVNLSLPGIAGIILTIGMAVDANVVIFERIKEELRSGKTIRSSVEAGFKRALTAIIDSNITTIIAGIVLLMFGTGPIKGFAITLLIGVVLSMFTVLVVSRVLLKQMAELGVTAPAAYGVRSDLGEPRFQRLQFSFIKNFKWFALPSLAVCLFSVVCLVLLPFGVRAFNLDIDFTGGATFHLDTKTDLTAEQLNGIADMVADVTGRQPSAPQKMEDTQVLLKMTDIDDTAREAVIGRIRETYPDLEVLSSGYVGSSFGKDLQRAAVMSILVASLLMLLYITIRFQFSSGLAAVCALLHDLLIIAAGYVIFQIPINMNFIAVMLTILGYSINSTIIVFDRVRENKRLLQKTPLSDIFDRGIKQTISRNINTNITTLLPVVCVIILGVSSVRNFAVPLTVGLLAGAYSSICLAGSLWYRIGNADKKATDKLRAKTR